jgi:site-specific DNA-methyltransferase (adenine-specific)
MKTKAVKISEVKLNPNNPRLSKDEKFAKLVQSIKDLPQMLSIRPIVVNSDMVVLGGNMRLKACKEAGLKEIPIIIADNLTEEQQREFLIKDNVSGGEWDWAMLQNDWDTEQLDAWGLDIPNFETEQSLEAIEDDYEVPNEIQTDIVLGDLFEIGEHRLLCGDSTDSDAVAKLMDGKKADMVFTDPPYGVDFVGIKGTMYQNGKKKGKDSYEAIKNDDLKGEDLSDLFKESLSNTIFFTTSNCPFYIFFAINKSKETIEGIKDLDLEIRNWLIWDKGNVGFHAMGAQYKPNYESFLYCFKNGNPPIWKGSQQQQTIWRHSVERLGLHPTMKPISLVSQAVQNHNTNLVLDVFLGSGSTMVASHQLKRKCYGMELDPKYCQVIVDRMIKLDPTLTIKRNGQPYKTDEIQTHGIPA